MLTITFKPTALLSDRHALIASLNGVIIGGIGSQAGVGDGYVLLPGNQTVTTIDSIAQPWELELTRFRGEVASWDITQPDSSVSRS